MSGGGPAKPDDWSGVGAATGGAGGKRARGAGAAAGVSKRRHGWSIPRSTPTATATAAIPTVSAPLGPCTPVAENPASCGPVVAVKVSAFTQFTFQIAVLRSRVKRAPGAEVISWGSVKAKVIVKIDESSSIVIGDCVPGAG